jgi:DNA-binding transcriptional ArsR family regulator
MTSAPQAGDGGRATGGRATGERATGERATGERATGERATDEALKAIAEPRRRAILRLVAHDELAAGEIAAAFDVTRTAISQHLTVLKSAGLLTERRAGTRRFYQARPEGLDGLREFLNDMWAASLDAARQIVEADRGLSDPGPSAQAG